MKRIIGIMLVTLIASLTLSACGGVKIVEPEGRFTNSDTGESISDSTEFLQIEKEKNPEEYSTLYELSKTNPEIIDQYIESKSRDSKMVDIEYSITEQGNISKKVFFQTLEEKYDSINNPADTLGLVGYWDFNEGIGNIAHDKTQYANSGTLINGPQWVDGYDFTFQYNDYSFWWYSQRDPEWADSTLGDPNHNGYSPLLTIGGYGCALTCIAVLYKGEASSQSINPYNLDVWCDTYDNNGYFYLQYPQGNPNYPGLYPAVNWYEIDNWDNPSEEEEVGLKCEGTNEEDNNWVLYPCDFARIEQCNLDNQIGVKKLTTSLRYDSSRGFFCGIGNSMEYKISLGFIWVW